jgi:N-acetylneuraminic acid mutarotase
LEVYDPTSNAWSLKANLPHLSACSEGGVINGQLYVVTPCDGYSGFRTFFDAYDPTTNTWSAKTSVPHIHANGAAGIIDGKLYVVGGYDGNSISGTLDVYDPMTNSWTTKTAMPTARASMVGGVIGGKLYVAGGADVGGQVLDTVEVYDPIGDSWTTEVPMPTARTSLAGGVIGSTLYAIGGYDGIANVATLEAMTVPGGSPGPSVGEHNLRDAIRASMDPLGITTAALSSWVGRDGRPVTDMGRNASVVAPMAGPSLVAAARPHGIAIADVLSGSARLNPALLDLLAVNWLSPESILA